MVEGLEDPGERIDAQVEEAAAGEVHVDHSVGGFKRSFGLGADGEVGGDAEDFSDGGGTDCVADGEGEWKIACPDGLHQEEGFVLCGGVEEFGLRGVDGEGFFAKDGFIVGEAEHHILEMVGVRGGDIDDVDVGVFREVFVRAVGGAGG